MVGCGRDSIGTCQGGCGRRLCGLHGPSSGTFICHQCTTERAARDQRQRDAAEAERRAAAARRRAEAAAELAACEHPEELRRVLIARGRDTVPDDCRAAWTALVSRGALEPTDEIVTVHGKGTPIGWLISRGVSWERGSWSEAPGTRVDLWRAPEEGRRPVEFHYGTDHWHRGDLWLDAGGALWQTRDSEIELSIYNYSRSETRFILPKGKPFKPKRGSKDIGHRVVFRRVPGARPVEPLQTDDIGYLRAVVAALGPVVS